MTNSGWRTLRKHSGGRGLLGDLDFGIAAGRHVVDCGGNFRDGRFDEIPVVRT